MNIQFHKGHVKFDPGLSFATGMTQAEAAALLAVGDKAKVVEGYAWLAGDIASRVLCALGLPKRLGEDLTGEGLVAIAEAVDGMTECPRDISAYLSKVVEKSMVEFLDRDSLCPVPTRTKRDRAAKRKSRADAPTFSMATDLAGDEEETNESVLSRLRRSSCPSDLEKPEDLYDYCGDQLDRDIINLRFNGPVPRAIDEIAEIAGVRRNTVEKRLEDMEVRVYADLRKRVPTCERTKGVRLLSRPKNRPHVETEMAATSA